MKKRILSLALAVIMLASVLTVGASAAFSDTEQHWSKTSIDYLVDEGDVNGYSDGTFKPDNYITRAEAAQMFANVLDLATSNTASPFPDVKADHWFFNPVLACNQVGVILGYPDGTFGPSKFITRQEAMLMLFRTTSITEAPAAVSAFKDGSSVGAWAAGAVGGLKSAGVINGYPDGTVRPLNYITRAEMAKMFYAVDKAATETVEGQRTGAQAVMWTVGNRGLGSTPIIIPGGGGTGGSSSTTYKYRVSVQLTDGTKSTDNYTSFKQSGSSPILADIFAFFNGTEDAVFAEFKNEGLRTEFEALKQAYTAGGTDWTDALYDAKVNVANEALRNVFDTNGVETSYKQVWDAVNNAPQLISFSSSNGKTYTVTLSLSRS